MVVIFGSSITKYLSSTKLEGSSDIKVINLSASGSKIYNICGAMDSFYTGEHTYFKSDNAIPIDDMIITKVIISVGTNDILQCKPHTINRLYIPLQNMMRKAKLLFNTEVLIQSVLPIPTFDNSIISDVHAFNKMCIQLCRNMRCRFIDVLYKFLDSDRYPDEKLYRYDTRRNRLDIHLSRDGLVVLGMAYIKCLRDRYDPFVNC
ncbi:SGNH/GDSL hydrolase family protein [Moritella sp.]|uniref:SGNH/GDSL hydrolase family protein n=1 Tax=Moritella sp. TaxID=78556 RepID=UPI00345893FE